MRRTTVCIYLCLALLAFGMLNGCGKKESDLPPAPDLTGPPAGDLNITFFGPEGQTAAPHETEQLVVMFDRPMVPLEALPEGRGASFLKIAPSVPGRYRWLGSRTLTFVPEKRFPYATEVTVTVPAEIRSLDNFMLPKEMTWRFRTIRPLLTNHFPRQNQRWLKPDTKILLLFNQAVDPRTAAEFLSLVEVDVKKAETSLQITARTPTAKILEEAELDVNTDQALLITPGKPLKPGFSYVMQIKEDFTGKEGPLGLEKTRIFTFETYTPFTFVEMESSDTINPDESLRFRFSNPVAYNEFIQNLQIDPAVDIPEHMLEWDHTNSVIWLNLPFQPETKYNIRISPDIKDEFGNVLGTAVTRTFSTNPYPPSVWMTSGHGVVESYGDLKYPAYAVNSTRVGMKGAMVPRDRVIPLLQQDRLLWSSDPYEEKGFFQIDKVFPLDLPRNERSIFPLDIKELTVNGKGFVFLQLDTFSKDKWDRFPKAFLQVTGLGISAKFSADNNIIWVTDLKMGQPVPGASLEIRDDNNRVRWSGKTGEDGRVESPGWKELKILPRDEWSKPVQWIFVEKEGDAAFLSSDWGTGGIDPYRFGINYEWDPKPEEYRGYIFSERGIYRAGEEVHIKGMLRRMVKGKWALLAARDVKCTVQDPFDKKMLEKSVRLDDFSSFDFSFSTDPEASLGYYNITAEIPGPKGSEPEATFYASFRVEAFRPAEFEVLLRTPEQSFVYGDDYTAEIQASYLFGGAMSGQPMTWHLRLNPADYSPPGHKGFDFGNTLERWDSYGEDQSRLLSSGSADLDKDGKFLLTAKLLPEEDKDSASASLEVNVQGPIRRSVSSRIRTIIHRGDFYIGLKPETSFLRKGEPLSTDVIAVDPSGEMNPGRKIQVRLIKREWQSVKKAEVGGRFRWITEKKDTEVDSRSVTSRQAAQILKFTPETAGFYLLLAEGKDKKGNNVTTSTYFYVTGSDYVPWERQDDDMVELVPDSDTYRPGDTAKILIKSPYEKTKALITVERESIRDSRVVDIIGSTSQIEVPILSEHIPNIYVSVLLVHGRTASEPMDDREDLGKPSFKIGYVELKVDPSEKRLTVTAESDLPKYKPGDTVRLKLNTRDWQGKGAPSSVTVAVVDLGVLSLIGYQTPDPFTHFNIPQPLSIQTSENRTHVVGLRAYGEKGADEGGGGSGERMMAAKTPGMSEIELRGNFKFTAYWNPSIKTNENGEATVEFELPDNLTTFRIMAVAQTKDSRFGQGEKTFRVSKPLLLQAALPRFARVGDSFKGGIVVQNQTESSENISVLCEADGIGFDKAGATQSVTIPPGEGREVLYDFSAEVPGTASFAFRARMGEETDGLEIKIPVQLPRPTETVALSDKTSETISENIKIPDKVFAEDTRVEFLGSASALTGLKGNIDALTNYPYLCLEQRISSIFPYIAGKTVIQEFKLSTFNEKEIQAYVNGHLKEIYAYQKDNGGFGLWPDSLRESPFNSCYAVFVLIKAGEAGYSVNRDSLDRAAVYLSDIVRGKVNNLYYPYDSRVWSTTRAYALYTLALMGKPEPAFAEKMFAEKESLSLFAKTLLLKALYHGKGALSAQTALVTDLLNKIKVTSDSAHFEDDEGRSGRWIYSSNLRTTALILQSLL
ncbi:MAG: MG2 domain-containing protein, partial [Candidatus Aminicenantes bacterium]|nr:MG2 domain-containing protein [Candidatus Aminicenantes bacterium]